MRGIIIDPYLKRVSEVELTGDLQSIYNTLSSKGRPISMIEAVYVNSRDTMYVDEEGLFKEEQAFFMFGGQPLAGRGLVVAIDEEGDTIGTTLEVDDITPVIKWGIHE